MTAAGNGVVEPADAGALNPGGQLQQPRIAQVVAAIIRNRIVEGELADGSRLPKQGDLLREFRVSQPSLREALRILESEGLLVVQRGNVGGAIVRAPSAQSSAYMFGLVLQSQHVVLSDLARAIQSVEPLTAALCAARRDRSTAVIPRLRAAQSAAEASLEDPVAFTAASRQFHEEVVRNCGNQTLGVLLGALETMWSLQERQWALRAEEGGRYPSAEAREEVLAAHRALLHAIQAGDDDHADRLARAHLRDSQRYSLAEGTERKVEATTPPGALLIP